MPEDLLVGPLHIGEELDGLLVVLAGDRLAVLKDALELVVFLGQQGLDLGRQGMDRQLLANHRLHRVAHRVPAADVAVQVEDPQSLRGDVEQGIA